jgi:hypothetical protein
MDLKMNSKGWCNEGIMLNSHYKFDIIDNMAGLLDVINKEWLTLFLHDDATRTITIVYVQHIAERMFRWLGGALIENPFL